MESSDYSEAGNKTMITFQIFQGYYNCKKRQKYNKIYLYCFS